MEKQTPESYVGSKSDWMSSYPESTSKHPAALANEDEDQSVYLRRQLAQRHTRRQNQASESPSLFKREFFGNEVGQGVVTLRPHYPPGAFDEATVPPLVILPAETLAPPFGSVINILKKKRYHVTFKPFKIAKAPKRVGSGESDKFGQTPAVSQLSRRSKIPQSSDDHTEERLISSQYQNRETFSSTMAIVGPHPNLGAKRNPQSFSTGGIFVRLQRFFKFKETEAKRPTSPSTQASILTSDSERLDFSKPPLPLPEIYLSQPDPTHQNAKAASNYQNLTADPNQKSHSLTGKLHVL
ncbi:uncharacterized protein PGTG_10706 [Puccinia graminis f. sp. tritici CRL 75-36-700-3]|uniref:Uncharacterized protein n=1 Tax=Puccinia graminis f. sp. tritici (strain CRL 75-36-700-3 / race SCCL) TaxID=418459 RepID=E3KJS2_PUCGT|nr:uncharacterized protein PGTG_10706 [Puccinia graminis f. sp. tritici CRL 75-36-700-3]EFP84547.2 hypothetical protein PGTG_10706 [Puccinia graminis f. sp. tritici CRL 75-36-700-3]